MKLVEALKSGDVSGIEDLPEEHVETVMSHVLIYKDRVRKIYKDNREGVFLDLRDFDTRKKFYQDDFYWNQDVSPHIHLKLHGVKPGTNNAYSLITADRAEQWFVEMRRIESSDTLVRRLLENRVSSDDIEAVTETQITGLQSLSKKWLPSYTDLLNRGLRSLWQERLDVDLRNFGYSFGSDIPNTVTDGRIEKLLKFFNTHPYFKHLNADMAEIAIDNHAGNVVFDKGRPHFIDIYLVKREWRVIDRGNNIARLASCIRVLGNDDLATTVYRTYAQYHPLEPSEVYCFLEAYNALIKGYYYTYLNNPELAKRYFSFADRTLLSLN